MAKQHLGLLFSGLVAGDALGSTSEFTSREEVIRLYEQYSDLGWPFKSVGGGYFNWRPGQPTDDTESASILVRSYLDKGEFDPQDIADRIMGWIETDPQDVGVTTFQAAKNLRSGVPWHEGGLADFKRRPMNASNGSLLRNGVIPGMADTLEEAYKYSFYHGIITHYAPRPVLCCAAHTFLIWEFLEGRVPLKFDWTAKKNWQRQFKETWTHWFNEACESDEAVRSWSENVDSRLKMAWKSMDESNFDPDSYNPFVYSPKGGAGYVVTALQTAVWATHWSRKKEPFPVPEGLAPEVFEKRGAWTLGWVALTGGDTDSYGSTAGPLIAAANGSIPDELTEGLEALSEFKSLV